MSDQYALMYNYGYSTNRVNDVHDNKVDSVTIDPKSPLGPVTVHIDLDVDPYALAPALIWVSDWKILGARYGAYILPTFANTSVGAALSTVSGSGRDVNSEARRSSAFQSLGIGQLEAAECASRIRRTSSIVCGAACMPECGLCTISSESTPSR